MPRPVMTQFMSLWQDTTRGMHPDAVTPPITFKPDTPKATEYHIDDWTGPQPGDNERHRRASTGHGRFDKGPVADITKRNPLTGPGRFDKGPAGNITKRDPITGITKFYRRGFLNTSVPRDRSLHYQLGSKFRAPRTKAGKPTITTTTTTTTTTTATTTTSSTTTSATGSTANQQCGSWIIKLPKSRFTETWWQQYVPTTGHQCTITPTVRSITGKSHVTTQHPT